MRRDINIIMVAILLALCSCTSMDEQMNGVRETKDGRLHRLYATTEQSTPATKVYADENMKVLWNAGDLLTVFNQNTYNSKFQFAGEDGDNAGNFEDVTTGSLHSGNELSNIYAVYPYASGNRINNAGNTITLTLPSEQRYKEHSFGIDANTMVAVTDNSFLAFKNLGGYLQLRLYGDNVKVSSITLRGNNGEKIAGKASVEVGLGTFPTVTMDNTATNVITLVCDPPVQLGATAEQYTDFWFVIPPVVFSGGFTITVTDDQGAVFQKTTTKRLVISRSTIEWMSPLEVVTDDENAIVHFADDNFKAYCVENFDTDDDGEISVAEAKVVTIIAPSDPEITSLQGIEFFTNLEELHCYGLKLTSLDVSHNTALTYLSCSNNHQLTSLDLSNNIALTMLDCWYSQLTNLILGDNTALTRLVIYGNQLTSLDVSHNTALQELQCSNNKLTSLILGDNNALTSLSCYDNQLTSLDVSHNTALSNLSCYNNRLTSLDVSKNTALSNLSCYNNRLTSLDVSNTSLTGDLRCEKNKLTSLNIGNTSISTLNCSNNQLTSLDINNNSLTELWCENNQLTSLNIRSKTLNILNCTNNQLSSLDLNASTSLTTLRCDSNQLTNLVINNSTLTYLSCDNNQLTSLDFGESPSLNVLLCNNNRLTSLDVRKNTELFTLCCENNNLTFLDISNNNTLTVLNCLNNPNLSVIKLNTNQKITSYTYDSEVTTIEYVVFIPDNNFKSYCIEQFDANADEEISLDEANCVIMMNVGAKYISSLEGIEFFTNLQSFSCNNNQMTELDVSNNLALTSLNCQNNPTLKVIWLKTGQTIANFIYDTGTATIQYKD